ncbi:uncharacterized protein EV420DRAFT_1642284 [Desarmillaria tabescens]|uniref:DUF7330 domain-containing protein n=1 Tax=Armillaria tabescens TaxID=1929756 RepID=A0AA39KE44_ARMTA|nr:uncharacterized protein EV420DRAFT_1642284 [Desarmillaria tabescens]KAK0459312.1 hypothetical protein EV420DRAFT_1642284 [Desarmillaria tabescens]
MIIADDTPESPAKTAPTNLPLQYSTPPPAYGSASLNVPRRVSPVPPGPMYNPLPLEPPCRRSPTKRFLKAFCVAILIWFLAAMFMSSIMNAGGSYRGGGYLQDVPDSDFPIPNGYTVRECIRGEDWTSAGSGGGFPGQQYSAHTSFDLPLKSETLFLLSQGSLSSGVVKVVTSPALTDVVRVDVAIQYYKRRVLDYARVCLLARQEGENGVGVFTPRWFNNPSYQDRPYFDITVTIPEPSSTSACNIKNFETDVQNFAQLFQDLENRVHFSQISLRGSNGPIQAESLQFDYGKIVTSNAPIQINSLDAIGADVRTTNSPIKGIFVASGSLVLKTSNAPIRVDVDLGDMDTTKSTLELTTSNNIIEAGIKLFSPSSDVSAHTSNGPLEIKVLQSPVDSKVKLDARTSNAFAEVWLPPTYEGAYSLSTSHMQPSLLVEEMSDPAGRGRRRTVRQNTVRRGETVGEVYWDERNRGRGTASVRSSNGPVSLKL